MQTTPSTTNVRNPTRLRRIEAMHGGLLYQHLYGVACLLMAAPLGWARLLVEFDEDLELQYENLHTYVQVKPHSGVVQPADANSALERFERYRQEHVAQNGLDRAELVLVLNSAPSPALAARISGGQIPSCIRVARPGHAAADLPPPWTDVDEAFAWCVARAEALPFTMVAADVLVLKLAGAMLRISSGRGEFASHAITPDEAAATREQFVHQLHEFLVLSPNYRPQDHAPALTAMVPVRLELLSQVVAEPCSFIHFAFDPACTDLYRESDGVPALDLRLASALPWASSPRRASRQVVIEYLKLGIDGVR